jgi:hypothetical protein
VELSPKRGFALISEENVMADTRRTDTDEHSIDDQVVRTGKLDVDEKLDIALEGSMMTSEPPQIAEPKTAEDDED